MATHEIETSAGPPREMYASQLRPSLSLVSSSARSAGGTSERSSRTQTVDPAVLWDWVPREFVE